MYSAILLFALTGTSALADAGGCAITNLPGLYSATYSEYAVTGKCFSVTARISMLCEKRHGTLSIEDEHGAMLVSTDQTVTGSALAPGDRIRASGSIVEDQGGGLVASCDRVELVSHGTAPEPITLDGTKFYSGVYDCRKIRIEGIVADSFVDEIDPDYMFLILDCDGRRITVATESDGRTAEDCEMLISKKVTVTGVCRPVVYGYRSQFGRNVRTTPENIHVLHDGSPDPFDAPEIAFHRNSRPEQVSSLVRRKMHGRVLAIWHGNRMLIRTTGGQLARISTSNPRLPRCGDDVDVVGFPETDLYRINLTRSLWRAIGTHSSDCDPIEPVSAGHLLSTSSGQHRFETGYHGRRIRIDGLLHGLHSNGMEYDRLLLECEGYIVPVDVTSCPEILKRLESGSRLSVVGRCIMDTESWSPYSFFPHIQEMFISVASPEDINILAAPPWWTTGRLLSAIGGLLLITCLSLIWSFTLKRAIRVKSGELKRQISARLESDLKTRERTRLAVELHDSISQNLSGMAMEIGSAMRLAPQDTSDMLTHLNIASRALQSCRDDLRDCLWDLRSKALESDDMNEAIRTTLKPYVNESTALRIRFNVPRKRLSDNTAHALLRIIRELVSNALKHGNADAISIAGSIDGRRLLFSVQDNGCGFDPATSPGVSLGHFGLQGIRERISRFEGKMDINSTTGKGTKVTLSMDISLPEEEDVSAL